MKQAIDETVQQSGSALPIAAEPKMRDLFSEYNAAVGTMSYSGGLVEIPEPVSQTQAVRISVREGQAPLFSDQTNVHSVLNITEFDPAGSLAQEFRGLVTKWHKETFALSSLTKIYAHPAYLRIMAMGLSGLPIVLRELRDNGGHWFYALQFMAGKNISAGIDNYEDARAIWLEWGYKNNYI